jgi:predicted 2-oxoglutarate/Fe(II)-dependent dioxygenase YbiX
MIQSTEYARKITMRAPVLFIPNVFDADFCRHIIHVRKPEESEESGMLINENGKSKKVFEDNQIRRRDYFLKEGETQERVRHFIRNRVRPEIQKAFHFEVTRFEAFNIVCYDASNGGYIRPHCDDTLEEIAYRRFAMTINLNVGEYEGGYLRFPDYGSDFYRPETGSAAIFSCSVLHEVTAVTKGRRFALLSFLYGEREAQQREEYNRRMMVS